MNILIVSATSFEIAPLLQHLEKEGEKLSFFDYKLNGNVIYPLVTGVGALNTAFGLSRYKDIEKTDVAINVGLAGAYYPSLSLGDVVEVTVDRFADIGVEERDGSFTDAFDLKLIDENQYPYESGWIKSNKPKFETELKKVTGLTVNKVHGTEESIEKITKKYASDVESMEGAGFLFATRMMDVHAHQFRAISNYVEPRNKENWQIERAIDNLNEHLIHLLNDQNLFA
ncbi:MAG: futalosine hydrolase [Saprospiraceae bacterium]|nr:futalosine hydrolase [Saprospiraceae bacterium]